MCPPEEQQAESGQPASPSNLGGVKRRRSRRGGHGRRRSAPNIPSGGQKAEMEASENQIEPLVGPQDEILARPAPTKQKFVPAVQTARVPRTDSSAIGQAVNEVMQVVESLKQTYEQMEEVLELVELAERQKLADEREIESLLRALRQLQSHGGRKEQFKQSNRPERRNRSPSPEPRGKNQEPEPFQHSESTKSGGQTQNPEPPGNI